MEEQRTVLVAYTYLADTVVIVDVGLSFNKVQEACQNHYSDISRLLNHAAPKLEWSTEYMKQDSMCWNAYATNIGEFYYIEFRAVSD